MNSDILKLTIASSVFAAEAQGILEDLVAGRITGEAETEFSERMAIYLSGRSFVMNHMAKGGTEEEAIAALDSTMTQISKMSEDELDAAVASI